VATSRFPHHVALPFTRMGPLSNTPAAIVFPPVHAWTGVGPGWTRSPYRKDGLRLLWTRRVKELR